MFLTGVWNDRALAKTRLAWLIENLGLKEAEDGFAIEPPIAGVSCITPADIPESAPAAPVARDRRPAPRRIPRSSPPAPRSSVRSVTRNLPADFQRHGEDSVGQGEVIHKLLEELSNGTLTTDRQPLNAEIERLLRLNGLDMSLSANLLSAISKLRSEAEVWSIVSPQRNSFAELPVMYRDGGGTIHTGRIDRVIVNDDEVRIYDYKTFAVNRKELPDLVRAYHQGQLKYYGEAMRKLYPGKKVSTFLVFTALPLVVPAGS
jgi:ATP-dependent helicase/nuclease subunit A